MKIAVCEDIKEEADWLCRMIRSWADKNQVLLEIVAFPDAASFYFTVEDTVYDALFLDIKMPGENGMDLAKRLRRRADMIPIVFVTGEKEYVFEGYEVEAIQYLLKPLDEEKVFQCLDKIYAKGNEKERYLIIQTEEGVVRLPQKEIYMIESFAHTLVYTTARGKFETNVSLKKVFCNLRSSGFVQCYRGVAVNLLYVESIGKTQLLLRDSKTEFVRKIPVSRRMYSQVNEAFMAFYAAEGKR